MTKRPVKFLGKWAPFVAVLALVGLFGATNTPSATAAGPVPIITQVSAPVAVIGATGFLIIGGENFVTGATVEIDGRQQSVIFVRPQTITFTPSLIGLSPGAYDIKVTNPGGESYTLSNGITLVTQSSPHVDGAMLSVVDGRKQLTIVGKGFIANTNYFEYADTAMRRSYITLNGIALPICVEGTGSTIAQLRSFYPTGTFSETPACYVVSMYADGSPIGATEWLRFNHASVWLPDDYDMSTGGTVSVNGSPTVTYSGVAPPAVKFNGEELTPGTQLEKRPTFTGTAPAFSTVSVTVRSDPVTCTTTADAEGNWSCTLPTDLPAGSHTVYVQVITQENEVIDMAPVVVEVPGDGVLSGVLPPNTGVKQAVSWLPVVIGGICALSVAVIIAIREVKHRKIYQ